ncbi:hypothetical protein [Niastella vici]|nr:hypothetical protein [Niastella vici]
MKIKFFVSHELEKPFRLSVHKNGKLGFPMDAAKALELSQEKSISIGVNDEDPNDNALYMVINESLIPGAFKVAKAGDYYYLPIKLLLDNLKVPYTTESVAFNMSKVENGDGVFYKLIRIVNEKKAPKADNQETQAL